MAVVVLGMVAGCSSNGTVGLQDGGPDGAGGDAALDGSSDAGTPPIPGLRALRIDPPTATVMDDGAAPGETAMFRAVGSFDDGDREVTAMVGWDLENARLGTLVAGLFTSGGIGGRSTVTAAAGDLSATAEVTVLLERIVIGDGVPPGAPGMFPEDTSGDRTDHPMGPRILYPSHETMFPRNLAPVSHQWRADTSLDLFEIRFESATASIRFYATGRSLLPAPADWVSITESNAGGSAILTVRGLSTASSGTVYRSQDVQLFYSASEVLGALYYWSTGAQGVMRGHISASIATKFYTDPDTGDDTCVACHTVSRDGRRLAVGYGGERLREVTIPERDLRIPTDTAMQGPEYGWGTFNPGATRLLYANRGALRLLDAETGSTLFDVMLPAASFATHPDWSPDGRYVAVAYGTRRPGNKEVQGSSLARLPVNADGTFGPPEILVESSADDDTLYFPSYSPDSAWIAYVRGTGGSKDNETSALFLIRADGSGEPVLLTRLNERVSDADGVTLIGNTMPTWAPSTTPDIFWLAFSSLRAYGFVLPGGRDQLWGAAIDPAVAAGGGDPGYAAFWMPFQQIEEGNHRAFWALAMEDECPSTIEICDMLDNDCDGIVDEDCCTPMVPEVCDDEVDNDCDGVADEGCGCFDVEDCDNGLDDDCDGRVDDLDEDCII